MCRNLCRCGFFKLPRHPFSGTRPELSRAYEDLLRVCLAQSTHCSRPMPSSLQPNPSHQELQEAQLVHFAEALLLAGVSGAGALSPWAKAILNQVWTLLNDGDPSSSSLEPGPQAIVFLEQRCVFCEILLCVRGVTLCSVSDEHVLNNCIQFQVSSPSSVSPLNQLCSIQAKS